MSTSQEPGSARQAKIRQAASAKGGPSKVIVGAVVLVLAIVVTVAAVIIADQASTDAATAGGSELPAGAAEMGAGLTAYRDVTLEEGAPTVDIYEDFQCPVCGRFEELFGDTVAALGESGEARIRYHVLTFLDDNLGNDSSTRAANAAMCAADHGAFVDYHAATFAGQPSREGQGWADDELHGFAEESGLEGDALEQWEMCVDEQSHNQYIEAVQEQASRDGVTGTPTVLLDGEPMDLAGMTAADFADAVRGAGE